MNWIELIEIKRKADSREMTAKEAGEYAGVIYALIRFVNKNPFLTWEGNEADRLIDIAISLHRIGATIPVDDHYSKFAKQYELNKNKMVG